MLDIKENSSDIGNEIVGIHCQLADKTAVWQFLLLNLSHSTLPVFVTHATCSACPYWSIQWKAFLCHFSHSR